ncbi:hypothetical protein AHiyo4_08200 [Arthrobacter sp. Hiyo4]|nr:hypothetical protein AHiyo4_08200 [Arthrobacter sp. Hiyo4]
MVGGEALELFAADPAQETDGILAGFLPDAGVQAREKFTGGRCQDQRRLVANRASGLIGSGRTVLTVNLRIAFTCATLTDNINVRNRFGFLLGK